MNIKRRLWMSNAEKKILSKNFEQMAKAYSIIAKNERINTNELEAQKELIDGLYQEIFSLKDEISKLKTKKTTTKKQVKLEEMN